MTATQSADLEAVSEALGSQAPVPVATGGTGGGEGVPPWVGGAIGFVALVVLWEVLALTVFHKPGSGVPTPTSVLSKFWTDFRGGLYGPGIRQTLKEAVTGYLVANVLAIVLAVAFVQLPIVEKSLLRVAIASYCLPIIAIGPILTTVLHGDAAKSALAALLVFFPTLVGVVVGLRSADRSALDVITSAGGGPWAQLFKVRLRAAIPSTFAALQVAAPSAILGAIVGEYLGAQPDGLGIMMVQAQAAIETARIWGIGLLCTITGGVAYLLTGVIGRLVAPWAPRRGRS
ncbi:MAG: ABC transporter permease subunit [Actinomycetota bacterium]|nr:ABC transporter permease subunit [Actinomycetota bacterium]MDQ6946799.1 ABC transporter permease subunit [Actinomycetota bacterium]